MAKSDNEEREKRILDAAADLIAYYGYDKTTVDDIARKAGVSKGAIYLHFQSKDDLFEGLLIREMESFADKWLELVDADPKGGTMAGMYKNTLYALDRSPFMSAMFRQDRRVFGNYLRKPDSFFRRFQEGGGPSPRHEFVKMMQDAGAMRQDLDPKVVAYIMNVMAYGLAGMVELVPDEEIPPMDDIIEGIALIMDRALTPEDGGNSEVGKAILRQVADAGRRQYENLKQSKQE